MPDERIETNGVGPPGTPHHTGPKARRTRPSAAPPSPTTRNIAARLVITNRKKKGQHPSPATVLRMLREHDEKTSAAPAND